MHVTQTPPNATKLEREHYLHLSREGFTDDEIPTLELWGLESWSKSQAIAKHIYKWTGTEKYTDAGLWFRFTESYGQLRFNNPLITKQGKFKYIGPRAMPTLWTPPGAKIKAYTEGWKDAAMPSVRGVPTGAIAGVSNVIYCVPQDAQIPFIFDSDGWYKPQVVMALVVAAIWTNGRINLFPPMASEPTGGACEFFRLGGDIYQYEKLIDEAMTPIEFLEKWIEHWSQFDEGQLRAQCEMATMTCLNRLHHIDDFVKYLESKVQEKGIDIDKTDNDLDVEYSTSELFEVELAA